MFFVSFVFFRGSKKEKTMQNFSMLIIKRLCFIVLISVVLLSAADSFAGDELKIDTIQMPPFGFYTENGKETGLLYDISNLIAEKAGFSYKNRIVPLARLLKELEHGSADFGIFLYSEKNNRIVIPVLPLFPLKNVVISAKGVKFESLESLHGKSVAKVREAVYDEAFEEDTLIKKYDVNNYEDGIRMLLKNRMDGMIGPEMGLFFAAKKAGYSLEDFDEPLLLNTKDAWLQFSKTAGTDKKINAVKSAAEELLKDGTIQKYIEKYVGK